jgi:hypothetical protein
MVELARPAHTEAVPGQADTVHAPIDGAQSGVMGTGLSWGDIASDIWGQQKQVWSDVLHGQMNAKEAGIAFTEEGLGLLAGGAALPIIGEPAVGAGAFMTAAGVVFMAAGNEMGE